MLENINLANPNNHNKLVRVSMVKPTANDDPKNTPTAELKKLRRVCSAGVAAI